MCNYTEADAQRFIDHEMGIDEEIKYVEHLADCDLCWKRIEEYSLISKIVLTDASAPDVKEAVYRRVNRSKSLVWVLLLSMVVSMALVGSHLTLQYKAIEANRILEALNNAPTNQDSNFTEVKVPAYMETSYSYANW